MNCGYRKAPTLWLATGAVTFGVGAALAMGAGVAEADAGDSVKTTSVKASIGAGPQHQARHAGPQAKTKSKATASPTRPTAAVTKPLKPGLRAQSATPPQVPQLPTPQMVIQQVVNVVVPLINNTPIRNILDAVDPPTAGTSVVRLLGQPVSTELSADGTRAYVTTVGAFGNIPVLSWLVAGTSTVNVIDTATNTIVGVPTAVQGLPANPVVSPDGSRAVQTAFSSVTDTTTVTVIDPETGFVVGNPVSVAGQSFTWVVVSPDSRRAYLSTSTYANNYLVAVIDTADSTLVAPPVEIGGPPFSGVTVSPDSSRVAQVSQTNDSVILTMIDPETGSVVGEPVVIVNAGTDVRTTAMFSQDGARISLITTPFDPVTFARSRVLTVFDSSTGELVGTPVVLPGYALSDDAAVVPDPSGNLVYVATDDSAVAADSANTYVTTVDTTNSTVVGTPVSIPGRFVYEAFGESLIVSPDRQRCYLTTNLHDGFHSTVSIVGADGALVGEPIPVEGAASHPVTLSLDGSRAYLVTGSLGEPAVTAIDTGTGAVVGTPVVTRGLTNDRVLLTPDGSLAFLAPSITIFEVGIPIVLPYLYLYIGAGYTRFTAFDTSAF